MTVVHTPAPSLPPPTSEIGVLGWLKHNLFSNWYNSVLSVLAIYLIYLVVPPVITWAIIDSNVLGSSKDDCTGGGACWVLVTHRWQQFLYGFYPAEERWRVNLGIFLGFAALFWVLAEGTPWKKYVTLFLCLGYPFVAFFLFAGGYFGLVEVETNKWGGLYLTLVVSGVGISTSLPIGIVLALGRRSDMPVIRMLCVGFIEFIRAVPLITILFMAAIMLPLFLPPGTNFNLLVRVLIGVSLFSAAYMAEVVRAGLQAIPRGQYEGAQALGLNYWKMMGLIILPQALKISIPNIVSSFIGLFKDTTLVLIIGLYDLLNITQLAVTDGKWLGLANEGYFFAGATFWVFCFSMSRYSVYLEHKLHTGH